MRVAKRGNADPRVDPQWRPLILGEGGSDHFNWPGLSGTGSSEGGADDRALLGRLWGLSGHDVATAQREQRRARREVDQTLRQRRADLEAEAARLLEAAPRLGRAARLDPASPEAL